MRDLFSGTGCDPRFVAVRDEHELESVRTECERLWKLYEPHAGPEFVSEFSRQFDHKFWEMHFGLMLAQHHPRVQFPKSGPDFVVPGPAHVSVEATVATKGAGADAVPEPWERDEDDDSVPFSECAMRVTAALKAKAAANRAREHAKLGPYVIAINMPFPEAWLCAVPPMSAIAALGCGGVTIDLSTGTQQAAAQLEISKVGGGRVPTSGFLTQEYEHISAIVVASVNVFSTSYVQPAFELLHNPRCTKALPRGWLPVGVEYWVDGAMMRSTRHH